MTYDSVDPSRRSEPPGPVGPDPKENQTMRRTSWNALLAAGLVLAGLAAGAPPAAAKASVLPVLSTSDAVGSIKPCGCHTPKGGFARIASFVDSTKMKHGDALVLDAGDFAPDVTKEYESPKLDFQFDVMGLIGYDAIGVGERELAFGVDRLKALSARAKLPIIASNLVSKEGGKPIFLTSKVVKKGNVKVGVFSLMSPKIELTAEAMSQVKVEDPLATAQRMVAELEKEADVIVVMAHLGRVEGEDLAAQVPGIDVVVLAHHPGFVAQGRRVNQAVTVATGEQIQNMGITLVTLDGRKVTDLSSETRVLLPEVGERADIARLTKDFEDRQNEAIKKAQAAPAAGTN
jgi:2',3'-cyclic-nucleotide 2'-phosphodiesterase (5'-nucleotidase family)